jgi:hypothetical protein
MCAQHLSLAIPFNVNRLDVTDGAVGVVPDVMQAAYVAGQPNDTGTIQVSTSNRCAARRAICLSSVCLPRRQEQFAFAGSADVQIDARTDVR